MSFQYADRMQGMNSSVVRETLKLTALPGIISFAGGMPSPEVFPVEQMRLAADKTFRLMGPQALQYSTTEGYAPLREKIARRMEQVEQIACCADDILMINGSQQAIDLSGKLFLNPGDVVVCENPTYTAALSSLAAYQCEFLSIASDEEGMCPDDLEAKLAACPRARMIYVIPTFQNPTGRTWSLERRKKLLEIAGKYNLPILEDNPYGELRYEGEHMPTLKSMDTQGIVVYLGSFSKVLSPGVRLGWILACPQLLERYNTLKQASDLQANTVMQYVVNQYLEDNDLDENIRNLTAVYKTRRDLMLQLIAGEFPAGSHVSHPQGGLFLWVEVPDTIETAEMMKQVVKQNVAYIPGHSFFANGGPTNTLRLNFSNATPDKIVEGMTLLGKALRELA